MKIIVARAIAVALLVVAIGLAAIALVTARDARPSWAAHIGSALFWLLGAVAVAGPVLDRPATARWLCAWGWTLPASLVWIGVEHFVDWTAFHRSVGPYVIRTPREAQQVGACFVLAGLGLFAAYAAVVLARHRRHALTRRAVARPAARSHRPVLVGGA